MVPGESSPANVTTAGVAGAERLDLPRSQGLDMGELRIVEAKTSCEAIEPTLKRQDVPAPEGEGNSTVLTISNDEDTPSANIFNDADEIADEKAGYLEVIVVTEDVCQLRSRR